MKWLLAFLGSAIATHLAGVAALPWLINAVATHRIAEAAGGANRAVHAPRADASARTIVRPSPDLLYTACVFDVRERPMRVTAPVQDSYVSIAGFAADTTNFFALNDAQLAAGASGTKRFDVVIARPGQTSPIAGVRVVEAPSGRGLILFRSVIPRDEDLARIQGFQAQQACAPL